MIDMNLEHLMEQNYPTKLKSEGERRIARFLEENSIKYQYETGVLVNSPKDRPRIWYPDFHLPEFAAYIEYYGLAGRKNYDRGIKRKESAYSQMGLDVIPVYPWTFTENWQGYIMKELEQTTIRRYKSLLTKPYWSQNRPTQHHYTSTPTRVGYQHGLNKRY